MGVTRRRNRSRVASGIEGAFQPRPRTGSLPAGIFLEKPYLCADNRREREGVPRRCPCSSVYSSWPSLLPRSFRLPSSRRGHERTSSSPCRMSRRASTRRRTPRRRSIRSSRRTSTRGSSGSAPDGELEPGLAAAFEVSADGLTYTFSLRQGVLFHDGRPFTASDVVSTFERDRNPETGHPNPSYYSQIDRIEAPDPRPSSSA